MNPLIWPSLKGWKPAQAALLTRRAVYGKVHRAPTDYRWFAWSGGFGASGPAPLQRDLAFSIEDQGISFCGWRYSTTGAVALRCYPSRASDAAGRPAVIEKQVLIVAAGHGLPPVALGFFVLPEVGRLDDTIWWSTWKDPRWQSLEYHLDIQGSDCPEIRTEGLDELLETGVKDLLAVASAKDLIEFYAQLLSEQIPAVLSMESAVLTPLALAALMLPLDRSQTEHISLAGGFPSLTFDRQRLTHWSGLACPSNLVRETLPISDGCRSTAEDFVRKLEQSVSANSWRLKPLEPELSSGGSKFLIGFLRSEERWFDPGKSIMESLSHAGPWSVVQSGEESEFLRQSVVSFIAEATSQTKGWNFAQRHMETKCDQLRALLLVLCPGADSLQAVGLPTSNLVPALLFAGGIEVQNWHEFSNYSANEFRELVNQSLGCMNGMAKVVKNWLVDCSKSPAAGLTQEYARASLDSKAMLEVAKSSRL